MDKLAAAREERKRARAKGHEKQGPSVEEAFKQLAEVFADAKNDCFDVSLKDPRVPLLRALGPAERQRVFQLVANTPGYSVSVRMSEDAQLIVPAFVFDWDEFWQATYDHFEYVTILLE